jgi:hypothetical protein
MKMTTATIDMLIVTNALCTGLLLFACLAAVICAAIAWNDRTF